MADIRQESRFCRLQLLGQRQLVGKFSCLIEHSNDDKRSRQQERRHAEIHRTYPGQDAQVGKLACSLNQQRKRESQCKNRRRRVVSAPGLYGKQRACWQHQRGNDGNHPHAHPVVEHTVRHAQNGNPAQRGHGMISPRQLLRQIQSTLHHLGQRKNCQCSQRAQHLRWQRQMLRPQINANQIFTHGLYARDGQQHHGQPQVTHLTQIAKDQQGQQAPQQQAAEHCSQDECSLTRLQAVMLWLPERHAHIGCAAHVDAHQKLTLLARPQRHREHCVGRYHGLLTARHVASGLHRLPTAGATGIGRVQRNQVHFGGSSHQPASQRLLTAMAERKAQPEHASIEALRQIPALRRAEFGAFCSSLGELQFAIRVMQKCKVSREINPLRPLIKAERAGRRACHLQKQQDKEPSETSCTSHGATSPRLSLEPRRSAPSRRRKSRGVHSKRSLNAVAKLAGDA